MTDGSNRCSAFASDPATALASPGLLRVDDHADHGLRAHQRHAVAVEHRRRLGQLRQQAEGLADGELRVHDRRLPVHLPAVFGRPELGVGAVGPGAVVRQVPGELVAGRDGVAGGRLLHLFVVDVEGLRVEHRADLRQHGLGRVGRVGVRRGRGDVPGRDGVQEGGEGVLGPVTRAPGRGRGGEQQDRERTAASTCTHGGMMPGQRGAAGPETPPRKSVRTAPSRTGRPAGTRSCGRPRGRGC